MCVVVAVNVVYGSFEMTQRGGDGSGLLIDVHATRRGSSSRERRLVFAPAAASQRLGESLIGAAGRRAEAECRGVRRMK